MRVPWLVLVGSVSVSLGLSCGSSGASTGGSGGTSTGGSGGASTGGSGGTSTGGSGGVVGADAAADAPDDAPSSPVDFNQPGAYPVGHAYFEAIDPKSSRTLPIEVWYPADESAQAAATQGTPLEDLEPSGAHHDTLAALVAAAPSGCTRKRVRSAADATPAGGAPFPVIVFSHCHNCARFSEAFVAERLASYGFAVVAPDHVGNTVYDAQAGNSAPINDKFLAVRVGDIRFTLDVVLGASSAAVPAALRGRFDAATVGVFGHSYGGATAAAVAEEDPRVRAALALAVPMESPAFPKGAHMAQLHVPVAFLRAEEDNSISTLGNQLIEQNFTSASPPAWLSRVANAGHWSFSDIAGLIPMFAAGCGAGKRMTSGQTFNYLDNDVAREIAAGFVTAFFSATLRAEIAGVTYLSTGHPPNLVTASARQ
ncbi:MAG: dienelactone hydrolase family protein [Sorangiineae bacterium]|nr:dienelactone hydrolase family protein [Polyangiaceae bacterium]MEB2322897.1 dienelactone hydrolase family protein [Sorangiineae bacterium]